MKMVFKIGEIELQAEGNRFTMAESAVECEASPAEMIEYYKAAGPIINEILEQIKQIRGAECIK